MVLNNKSRVKCLNIVRVEANACITCFHNVGSFFGMQLSYRTFTIHKPLNILNKFHASIPQELIPYTEKSNTTVKNANQKVLVMRIKFRQNSTLVLKIISLKVLNNNRS